MDLSGKRLTIFGCGYLGIRVARQALARNMKVTALTRNLQRAQQLEKLGAHQVVRSDLDGAEWHSLIDPRQDFVLDCVASAGGGLAGYRKSYLEGMRSILRWAEQGEVGSLLFTGSTSVYAQDGGDWVDETAPADGSSEGGEILREAEGLLLESNSVKIGRRFVLRLGGIYGPGRHRLLDLAVRGDPVDTGDTVFLNAIHVDDAVGAIWAAFESSPAVDGGVFNIVDDMPTAKGEIVRYLRARVKDLGIPPGAGPSSGASRRPGSRPSRRISNAKAREVLGWKPDYPDYRSGYEPLLAEMHHPSL